MAFEICKCLWYVYDLKVVLVEPFIWQYEDSFISVNVATVITYMLMFRL